MNRTEEDYFMMSVSLYSLHYFIMRFRLMIQSISDSGAYYMNYYLYIFYIMSYSVIED